MKVFLEVQKPQIKIEMGEAGFAMQRTDVVRLQHDDKVIRGTVVARCWTNVTGEWELTIGVVELSQGPTPVQDDDTTIPGLTS